jgi:uncharacterized repeat protein (TIGR04076 family)
VNARITVIKRSLNRDIFERHLPAAISRAKACPEFEEGQTFLVRGGDHLVRPEGFCDYAWMTLERLVARACAGEELMMGTAFPCCADGLRPVTFHIEPSGDS